MRLGAVRQDDMAYEFVDLGEGEGWRVIDAYIVSCFLWFGLLLRMRASDVVGSFWLFFCSFLTRFVAR